MDQFWKVGDFWKHIFFLACVVFMPSPRGDLSDIWRPRRESSEEFADAVKVTKERIQDGPSHQL